MKKYLFILVIFVILILVNYLMKSNNNNLITTHQSDMELCQSTIFGENFPISDIKLLLNNHYGTVEEYLAIKTSSQNGINYFLLVNYKNKSLIITYFRQGGLRSRIVSSKYGDNLFLNVLTSEYKVARSEYGQDSFHPFCEFIKIQDSNGNHYIEILNGGEEINSKTMTIRNNISKLISNEYNENYLNEKGNELKRIPTISTIKEIKLFNLKLKDDVFYELNLI